MKIDGFETERVSRSMVHALLGQDVNDIDRNGQPLCLLGINWIRESVEIDKETFNNAKNDISHILLRFSSISLSFVQKMENVKGNRNVDIKFDVASDESFNDLSIDRYHSIVFVSSLKSSADSLTELASLLDVFQNLQNIYEMKKMIIPLS